MSSKVSWTYSACSAEKTSLEPRPPAAMQPLFLVPKDLSKSDRTSVTAELLLLHHNRTSSWDRCAYLHNVQLSGPAVSADVQKCRSFLYTRSKQFFCDLSWSDRCLCHGTDFTDLYSSKRLVLVVLSSMVVVVVLAAIVVVVTLSSLSSMVVVVVMLSAMVVVTAAVSVLSSLQPWRKKANRAIRTARATARTDIMAAPTHETWHKAGSEPELLAAKCCACSPTFCASSSKTDPRTLTHTHRQSGHVLAPLTALLFRNRSWRRNFSLDESASCERESRFLSASPQSCKFCGDRGASCTLGYGMLRLW